MSGTAGLLGHLAIGDNLHILREYVNDESVDLIYLDPPFNSNRAYSLIFKDPARGYSEAQAVAFKDQWTWNAGTEARFRDLLIPSVGSRATTRLSRLLANQVAAFERTQMAAYLVEMAVRLVELHRVLKPTGSLYLHCDPTASHYLKVVLDAIFGPTNFRNEIIWRRTGSNSAAKRFGPIHQTIFYYVKTPRAPYYPQTTPYTLEYVRKQFRYQDERGRYRPVLLTGPGVRQGPSGQPWRHYDPTKGGRHWQPSSYLYAKYQLLTGEDLAKYPLIVRLDKLDEVGLIHWGSDEDKNVPQYRYYLEDAPGVLMQDIWAYTPGTEGTVYGYAKQAIDEDVRWLSKQDAEYLEYPTQKPVGLLSRIIRSSTQPGDLVLDPFCGCGTTIEAAQTLDRQWIGIDISVRALDVINDRFQAAYGEGVPYRVLAPADEEAARRLAETKPHGRQEFEAWALTLIGARKNVDKDRGVDGLIPFIGPRGRLHEALVSVKSGRTKPAEVRELVGAVHRERSPAGIFVTLGEPTKEMRLEAARAIPLIPGVPRIQIITIRDALREDRPARPILPAYRQQELFEAIPDGSTTPLADLEDELRAAIVSGREARAAGRREWRAQIIETMQNVLEAEPDLPPSRVAPRSPRTSKRGR